MSAADLPKIEIPRREALASQIARRLIEHYFTSGRLSPGDRLPSERDLAEGLGVGRAVVREALKSLGLLGLVEVRQGDGTYLSQPDTELLPRVIEWGLLLGERRIVDLVEARTILERDTARLAAERRTDADLAELERLLGLMQSTRDAGVFVDADIAFHLRVAHASGNSVLADVLSSIQSLMRVWVSRVVHGDPDWQPSYRAHVAVLAALRDRDPQAAAAAMDEHFVVARGRLERTLNDHSSGVAYLE